MAMEINKKKIFIDEKEVLRYLGYKGQKISLELEELLYETIGEAEEILRSNYTYRYFQVYREKGCILLGKVPLILRGKDISQHLCNSNGCFLLCGTIGCDIDRRIRYYEKINLTKAIILDACGTVAIESLCNYASETIKNHEKVIGKTITTRYSPGYGDLSIDIQKDFLESIDATKIIGVTTNSEGLLLPRKSITAIIGVIPKEVKKKDNACSQCENRQSCEYRRERYQYGD